MSNFLQNCYMLAVKLSRPLRLHLDKAGTVRYWDGEIAKRLSNRNVLTKDQIKQSCQYFSRWKKNVSMVSHSFYTEKTGIFNATYIPDGFYYAYVDQYFNDWYLAGTIDNKTYYSKMFPDVKQPEMVCCRINNYWYSKNGDIIEKKVAVRMIYEVKGGVVAKLATNSCGGAGIRFLDGVNCSEQVIESAMDELVGDLVVQKRLIQSHALNRLNESSVNTIRVLTLLDRHGKAKAYSSILRMGINGSKVDNASAGGITCGIKEDGTLKDVAYSTKGVCYDKHPTSGVKFNEIKIPRFAEIKETALRLAVGLPHFRLVSWDFAVDCNEEIVLIEANLCSGELDFHQLNNGPLFLDDQRQVLDEVFGKGK